MFRNLRRTALAILAGVGVVAAAPADAAQRPSAPLCSPPTASRRDQA